MSSRYVTVYWLFLLRELCYSVIRSGTFGDGAIDRPQPDAHGMYVGTYSTDTHPGFQVFVMIISSDFFPIRSRCKLKFSLKSDWLRRFTSGRWLVRVLVPNVPEFHVVDPAKLARRLSTHCAFAPQRFCSFHRGSVVKFKRSTLPFRTGF